MNGCLAIVRAPGRHATPARRGLLIMLAVVAATGFLAAIASQQYLLYLASRAPAPERGAIHPWEGADRLTVYLTTRELVLVSPVVYFTIAGIAFSWLGGLLTWTVVTKRRTSVLVDPQPEPRRPNPCPSFRDSVLAELRRLGSDASRPHEFDFFLYLPTHSTAWRAAERARRSEFSTSTLKCRSTNRWFCRARATLVPELAPLDEIGAFFEQLAAALDVEFDGWEAEIVKAA